MGILYGIKQCDSCRKAAQTLDRQGVAYRFHDFRKEGLDLALLQRWESLLGWETLLNRKSTTWRALPEDFRTGVDREKALGLMKEYPTLIKRPIWDDGQSVRVGVSTMEAKHE
jgi:arsenate reductase (glutaredoxin)